MNLSLLYDDDDGQPVEGVEVMLIPTSGHVGEAPIVAVSDENGNVVVNGLLIGDAFNIVIADPR